MSIFTVMVAMWLNIDTVGAELDGQRNYLLHGQYLDKEYYVAYTTDVVLPSRFAWRGVLECHTAMGDYGPINVCVPKED